MNIKKSLIPMPDMVREQIHFHHKQLWTCHAVETFFKTIKAELIWRDTWDTRRQAEMAIFEYINGFYNPRRRHSALGWKSPVAFERKVA